ncbi:TetR/AcrR family transcriptional regulator [Nocardia zapadnayensis]|uniref:TetR/AcrR family transcriptional regulator n=1 Tax=Nocardia rhamnosiphila TaxID=426716 RepID=UPI002245CD9B|nr:TetR/AcrR family transcriptional regulator [Nocardia zapadnayensis]MCX0271235.1 TetR/AcrR family transcriptional regulator [Nocardia zapadnayensis]
MTQSGKADPAVWARPDGRRGPAPSHSREELAAAAIELAGRGGLAAVSTRRIAQQLGVSQSALYRYVSGRDDVLDLMVDAAAGEIDLDVPLTGVAIDDLTALGLRAKNVYLKYPWLLDIPVEPLRVGPRGIDYLEYALRAMAAVDAPGQVKLQTVAVLNALVQQFARAELDARTATESRRIAQAAYVHKIAEAGHHPYLADALGTPNRDASPGELFELLLRRALAGVLAPD